MRPHEAAWLQSESAVSSRLVLMLRIVFLEDVGAVKCHVQRVAADTRTWAAQAAVVAGGHQSQGTHEATALHTFGRDGCRLEIIVDACVILIERIAPSQCSRTSADCGATSLRLRSRTLFCPILRRAKQLHNTANSHIEVEDDIDMIPP